MLLSKFIDACTDVLMGIVVDMTRTKWGKCRPYFLFGAIPPTAPIRIPTEAKFANPHST